ncbi:MAG: hypothetical protein KME13_22450 [Myxacorys californica WJT36-NPBG1]|jgi:hypothetical protein|nr:hypothetical protein [Myxacorys californica WJT36-NPBG1]
MNTIASQIPLEDQLTILQAIKELPPTEASADCNTDDQKQHWQRCKLHYAWIRDSLKAYFRGDASSLPSLPPKAQEFAELRRDYYLALYGVLHEGWNFISEEIDYPEAPTTPAEMLTRLLKWDSVADLVVAFPEYQRGNYREEFSPRKAADFYRQRNKAQELLATGKELSRKEKSQIAKYKKELVKQRKKWSKFSNLRELCLEICRAQPKKSSSLQEQLGHLDRISADLEFFMISQAHARNNPRGWAWDRGRKLPSAPGGTYR